MGEYRIILADPNWDYNSRSPWKKTRFGGGVAGHYETSGEAILSSLGPSVKALCADRAVCCMWVTGTHMETAFRVMRAWGFKPIKPIMVWVKTTPKGKLFTGPGYYTASNAEYILLGTKGQPWHANRRNVGGPGIAVPEVVMTPHPRDAATRKIIHSAKPAVFRDHIVRLFGDLPRIELFARERADGWEAVGDQLHDRPCLLTPEGIQYLERPAA